MPSKSCILPAREANFDVFIVFRHSKALKGNAPKTKVKTMKQLGPTSVRKVFLRVSFCLLLVYESLLDVNNAVVPRRHNQYREHLDKCKEGVFESFCLLMKACSSGWSNLEHVCVKSSAILVHSSDISFSMLGLS